MIRPLRYERPGAAPAVVDVAGLAAARRPGGLLWIDVVDPTAEEIATITDQLGIHHLVAEDLVKAQQRTKLVRYGDHAHVALRDCLLDGAELVSTEVDLVVGDGWLLSVREDSHPERKKLSEEVALRFERETDNAGVLRLGFLVWAFLDVVVDRYFDVTSVIDERLDDVEDIVFAETGEGIPREIFELRRALVGFRRAAAPLREVLSEVLRRDLPDIAEDTLAHFQDVYDHVLRVLDLVESQRELLTGLLEGQLAVISNHMNQVMKATSSWGAILIVATLIAGIYGMNFRHMPELDWRLGYPMALGMMVLVTAGLYRVFKRRGWL